MSKNKSQISFKVRRTPDGDEVDLCLPGFADKPTPPALEKVLGMYGFVADCGDSEGQIYVDGVGPKGNCLDEELCLLTAHLPLRLVTHVVKGKRSQKTCFEAQIAGAPIATATGATSEALWDVFCKAYDKWCKAGRPIEGVLFKAAMQDAVDRVNKDLSKKARSKK